MPTNVTPDYRKAEETYRQAREPRDKLACLKEMLRTIPKHKGTDHLQADIKSRIKQLTEELSGPKKGANRQGPTHSIHAEGAAQIALLGAPNSGKSALHARLTGSRTEVGPYPMTTREPVPGMLAFEDVNLQLVDLPAITSDYMESWLVNALQPADAALLVADLTNPGCVDQVQIIMQRLAEKKIHLLEHWPGLSTPDPAAGENVIDDPFCIELPTLLVATKSDLDPDPDEVKVLEELLEVRFPALACSATTGEGCAEIGSLLFRGLQILRIYTKTPGKPFQKDRPFTVRQGETVLDVARLVHKDFASGLRYARVWGSAVFDGQQVGPEHQVCDQDIIELHMR
jgi:hypothetical protein